jgi:hypothetical protein
MKIKPVAQPTGAIAQTQKKPGKKVSTITYSFSKKEALDMIASSIEVPEGYRLDDARFTVGTGDSGSYDGDGSYEVTRVDVVFKKKG